MKTLALASATLLTTLSLAATPADPPAQKPATATTTAPATTPSATTTLAAPAPAAPNSLAAAAAATAAARGKKKAKISITNDNLSKSGGHITSGSTNPAALPPTPPAQIGKSVEEMVAEAEAQKKAFAEQQKKKAEEERRRQMVRAEAAENDNALDANDDPARVEHNVQQTQGTQQKTSTVSPEQTAPKPPVD